MGNYKTNIPTIMYWAESSGFISGRDALGIQNSSVAIYSTLLPGITNVTERLRFYGFHCWLLSKYDEIHQEGNQPQDQFNFIRRAELIIAFYMQSYRSGYLNIPGKAFATDFLPQLESEGTFDLNLGADQGKFILDADGKQRSYWKLRSGAMGQYYSGSLQALNLIYFDRFFALKPKGKALAAAFEGSLSSDPEAIDLFLQSVEEGQLKMADLVRFAGFDISAIPPESEEGQFYLDVLFGPDTEEHPLYLRQQTLVHFLEVKQQGIDFHDRLLGRYFFLNPDQVQFQPTASSLGWLIYFSQELIHYALEQIFYAMLLELRQVRYSPIHDFVEKQLRFFEEELSVKGEASSDSLDTWARLPDQLTPEDVFEAYDNLYNTKATQSGSLYYHALRLILVTAQCTIPYAETFKQFLFENGIGARRGNILEWHKVLRTQRGQSVSAYFKALLYQILNDHQLVAFDKMGNGEAQTHKFLIEHGHLSFVNTIEPRMTTPRLKAVRNMLEDLSLLDTETKSQTSRGLAIIEKYKAQ